MTAVITTIAKIHSGDSDGHTAITFRYGGGGDWRRDHSIRRNRGHPCRP
jgi:hypothetical protein